LLLSERHPEKQGLKHIVTVITFDGLTLSERHPEKQGLKPINATIDLPPVELSERHPEKQGLKLIFLQRGTGSRNPFRAPSRKTRIETLEH